MSTPPNISETERRESATPPSPPTTITVSSPTAATTEESQESRLLRTNSILEGRLVMLQHENTHLRGELAQLGRSMEDVLKRYAQQTQDQRKTFQITQDMTMHHAREVTDLFGQMNHHQHQANLFREQANILQQQVTNFQHQVSVLTSQLHHQQQQQQNPQVPTSTPDTSVYVFDKAVQTEGRFKPGMDSMALQKENKNLSVRVHELEEKEADLRQLLEKRDADATEKSQQLQRTQRSLQESQEALHKLSKRPATCSSATDVEGLPQAVPIADAMVFGAMLPIASAMMRPIQVKLIRNSDPLNPGAHGTLFQHLDTVGNLAPAPDCVFTFANDIPSPRSDDDDALNHRGQLGGPTKLTQNRIGDENRGSQHQNGTSSFPSGRDESGGRWSRSNGGWRGDGLGRNRDKKSRSFHT